jgi:hypothetical protein
MDLILVAKRLLNMDNDIDNSDDELILGVVTYILPLGFAA